MIKADQVFSPRIPMSCSDSSETPLTPESPAVGKHLDIILGVIKRTAENSRSCKVWCITLVSAVLVLVARTDNSSHATLALVPTALFFLLDMYYLSLERGFRKSYENFVDELHSKHLRSSSLYTVAPVGSIYRRWAESLLSLSIGPFYGSVAGTVVLAWKLIT